MKKNRAYFNKNGKRYVAVLSLSGDYYTLHRGNRAETLIYDDPACEDCYAELDYVLNFFKSLL